MADRSIHPSSSTFRWPLPMSIRSIPCILFFCFTVGQRLWRTEYSPPSLVLHTSSFAGQRLWRIEYSSPPRPYVMFSDANGRLRIQSPCLCARCVSCRWQFEYSNPSSLVFALVVCSDAYGGLSIEHPYLCARRLFVLSNAHGRLSIHDPLHMRCLFRRLWRIEYSECSPY